MISYYGSKSKLVDLYPEPIHDKIIEPFAGSARYSLKYWDKDVLLIDKYEPIIKMWHWLQQATEKDLGNLPVPKRGESLLDFNLSEGEHLFLSFIVSEGVASPRNIVTKRASSRVNHKIQTTKDILNKIKHWDIRLGDYEDIENQEATWFIDPPYFNGGEHYPKGSKYIDYKELANWCKSRQGQVIVCENDNANWLPFTNLKEHWGGIKRSVEVMYYQEQ
jgi:site-specific DNA-adenine methylase